MTPEDRAQFSTQIFALWDRLQKLEKRVERGE